MAIARSSHFGPVRHFANPPVVFAVLVIFFAAAVLAPISFHYRGDSFLFVLSEVPLLLGLVFASPAVLVLARLAGQAVALGIARRQSPLKLLFNLTAGACGAAAAAVVYHAVLAHRLAVSPVGSAAGAAALAAAAVTAHLSVHLVVRLNGNRVPRRRGFEYTTESLVLIASVGLAFVVLDAAWWDRWAVVPLVVVGALIVFAYRGYSRLTQRFSALQRLYDFSDSLGNAHLEPRATSSAVLQQVQTVMRARRAQLVLVEESGATRRLSLSGGELTTVEALVLHKESIVTQVIDSGLPNRLSSVAGGPPVTGDPIVGDFRDAVVVPLKSADRIVGALVALDREEALDTFDADDLRLFEALAAHAVSSIERARLVEELRYEAEAKLYQATHDMLTKLPNRSLFLSRAAEALDQTGRAAIALLDIDRFKDVNDTLGHDTGDRLLCQVSERLVQAARGRATVARLGGDEFALVVPDIIGQEEAIGIVRDLYSALSRPVSIDGLTLAITASAGIALAPEHGGNVASLLQRADIAMYLAKERRSGIEVYSPSRDQSVQRRLMLGGQLLHALEAGDQLSVMYQPIADLSTGDVLRVEALARWEHPVHGWIPATEFIEIAEQMGLVDQVTEFVLTEALTRASEWRRSGLQVGLAVNLSGRELSNEQIVDLVATRLEESDFPAPSLTLELTETEVMADLGEASAVLTMLARLGIRIAVDDYGTGYSSLAYLHRLPVQELKIDRSFVTNLEDDASNRIIVRSSIAMAHSLGLSVVAEGAEDEVTCAILADAGCDSVQGYYLSRPKTAADLQQWLSTGARLEYSRELPSLWPLRIVDPKAERETNGRGTQRGAGA
ncbi:MAG: putative bifunctional diguanylate cyclase/phosphodiesterase [Acidimicrobiales bacterium]